VTIGGIRGTVAAVDQDSVVVKVADGVTLFYAQVMEARNSSAGIGRGRKCRAWPGSYPR